MKVGIMTSGVLPVPAQKGGAVENLIDCYIEQNEIIGKHDFTIYSVSPIKKVRNTNHARYKYVNPNSFIYKLRRWVYCKIHKDTYYHPYTHFFLHHFIDDIKHNKFDVIILENRPGYAIELAKNTNAKIITHLHTDSLDPNDERNKDVCRNTSMFITVSDYLKRRVLQIDSSAFIKTVYNGIDLNRFKDAKSKEKTELGFCEMDFVLVYFGRISSIKGVKEILMAMHLLNKYQDIKLLVIGSSTFSDTSFKDDYMNELCELSKSIEDRIIFTGFVPYSEIPSYIKACDVAVLPSLCEEAFGLSMLEAMACDLPLITTNAGGIPEVCSDSCILLERDNDLPNKIADSIVSLYSKRTILGTNNKYKDISMFDKQIYAKNMIESIS